MDTPTSKPSFIPERWKDRQGAFYDFRAAWWYRNAAGEPQGVVVRYDCQQDKQIIPFFKPDKRGGFKTGGPQAPVLYGVDKLNGFDVAFVTEGEKCASALHSLGLPAVSAQGGANKAAGGAWDALAGVSTVYLLPDNDKPGEGYARTACKALARLNPAPEVRVIRLPVPEKGDVVDWIQQRVPEWNGLDPLPDEPLPGILEELFALARQGEPPPADWLGEDAKPERPEGKPNPSGGRYVATPSGIKVVRFGREGIPEETPLSNFTARIVAEIVEDDGAETQRKLTLEGEQGGRPLARVTVSYDEFAGMTWPGKSWGTQCIIEPGNGKKDTLRAAIQTLSHAAGAVERRTVYIHTGWRKVDGAWLYLHGAGAMGAAGPATGIDVELKERLGRYALPAPSSTPEERREAAAASMACLDLAHHAVSLPLLACAFLAPLAQTLNVDFMVWLEAPSQSQKSSIAAVMLAHFGAAIDRTCLTANWTDTANALEGKLFTLMDTLAVIDDYAPQPSASQQASLDFTVSRMIRDCGNRQGRGRLRADLSQRPERYPRGLVISTAEQWPGGESINGRLFGVTLKRGDVDLAALTRAQAAAERGLLARCMADYIQDLAARFDTAVKDAKRDWLAYRAAALQQGLSGRAPEQVAFLLVGAQLMFCHFKNAGLPLTDMKAADTLLELARRHTAHVLESQPADRFRLALAELLASGAAHVEPLEKDNNKDFTSELLRGPRIGWHNAGKGEIYLLATPALEAVNEALRKGDTGLNIRPNALWRQCQQRGWLQPGNATETGQETTRTVKIAGKSERVLVFNASGLER